MRPCQPSATKEFESYFDGRLDEVAVFDRVVPEAEIQMLRTGYRFSVPMLLAWRAMRLCTLLTQRELGDVITNNYIAPR